MPNSDFSFPKKDPKDKSVPPTNRKDVIKALNEFRDSLVSMQKAFEKLSGVIEQYHKSIEQYHKSIKED